jgi:hypothetical protein
MWLLRIFRKVQRTETFLGGARTRDCFVYSEKCSELKHSWPELERMTASYIQKKRTEKQSVGIVGWTQQRLGGVRLLARHRPGRCKVPPSGLTPATTPLTGGTQRSAWLGQDYEVQIMSQFSADLVHMSISDLIFKKIKNNILEFKKILKRNPHIIDDVSHQRANYQFKILYIPS